MGDLVDFFLRSRNFILFLLLEVVCFYFIISSSNYWGATYFNTANRYTAQVLTWTNAANEYASLRQVNANLALENAQLRSQLTRLQQSKPNAPAAYVADTAFADRFTFTVAKVINNTTQLANNYITIDKGTEDGLQPGMGVISPAGIVGKVRICNAHFSVITSVLHSDFLISSRLIRHDSTAVVEEAQSSKIGTAQWVGENPRLMNLDAIPRYQPVSKGDSVVTSEFNATFGPGILVGRVQRVGVQPNQTFHDIKLTMATNFSNLSYVYVIRNRLQAQQEQLEKQIETEK